MSDIIIPLPESVTREAVAPKEFSELFIMDLSIRAHQIGEQDSIVVEYVPYDKATGDRLLSDRREIRLPLWETVQLVPEAAQAFGAIAYAIPALIARQSAKRAEAKLAAL